MGIFDGLLNAAGNMAAFKLLDAGSNNVIKMLGINLGSINPQLRSMVTEHCKDLYLNNCESLYSLEEMAALKLIAYKEACANHPFENTLSGALRMLRESHSNKMRASIELSIYAHS